MKLTRLLRLARLLQKMDRYSQYSAVILTMLMLFFIVVAHWLACIWYVIAEKERLRNDKDWDLGECNPVARVFTPRNSRGESSGRNAEFYTVRVTKAGFPMDAPGMQVHIYIYILEKQFKVAVT